MHIYIALLVSHDDVVLLNDYGHNSRRREGASARDAEVKVASGIKLKTVLFKYIVGRICCAYI